MSVFAVINGQNQVENIVRAEDGFKLDDRQLIRLNGDEARIGDTWTGDSFARKNPLGTLNPMEERIHKLEQLVADLAELVLFGGDL